MRNALAVFQNSLTEARNLNVLHDHIKNNLKLPFPVDDLLRSQIVYAVGAFDKLIHDLIRIGMVEIFMGNRVQTPKYLTEAFSLQTHAQIMAATIPPPEFIFSQVVATKLGYLSFQDPKKVADGLALIWAENGKWDRIAIILGDTSANVQLQLKLISQRRNSIVHESDMDPLTNQKSPITANEATDICNFITRCGQAITSLLT